MEFGGSQLAWRGFWQRQVLCLRQHPPPFLSSARLQSRVTIIIYKLMLLYIFMYWLCWRLAVDEWGGRVYIDWIRHWRTSSSCWANDVCRLSATRFANWRRPTSFDCGCSFSLSINLFFSYSSIWPSRVEDMDWNSALFFLSLPPNCWH